MTKPLLAALLLKTAAPLAVLSGGIEPHPKRRSPR